MKRYAAYLFDLDGTLYRGSEPVPYAVEVLTELRRSGAQIGFLTNNSGTTPGHVAQKLVQMGFDAAPSEVATSGMAAVRALKDRKYSSVFVVGEPGLVEVLRGGGLQVANVDAEGHVQPDGTGDVDAVVCGICRSFTYALLDAALQRLLAGAAFFATNPDATYPMEGGRLQPGAGSLVAALETCSGTSPIICGKPRPDMVFAALERMELSPNQALIVGDRPDTDLAAGQAAGCDAMLVLTGVTRIPTLGVPAIEDLRGLLR